jgi:hypothetical protein
MAVIFSYPVKSTPELTDKMLISDGTDNLTKQVTISGVKDTIDVVDSLAATLPIEVSASSGTVTVSSRVYAGAATTGYVPTGGSNTTFLRGDGTWVTPSGGGAANPAGNSTEVQYNSGGTSFGASDLFTYANRTLSLGKVAATGGSHLKVYGGGSDDGKLTLYCSAGTHGVTIDGPDHTGGSNYTLKLPASLPSVANQILESNASGTLSWIATPTGGGGSYQAGNGVDINTSTNPDTISTGLLANGGLVFNTNKMQVDLAATAMSGELRAVDGGTGYGTYVVGEMLYAETTSTLAQLSLGTNDKILGVNNGATAPQWITNLVGQEVTTGHMLIGAGTSAMTAINTTAKGTIAVGSGSTTTTKAVGTDGYVLTAKSADATGVNWEAITFPTVDLTSDVTGALQVGNGGTGLTTATAGTITRGNGTSAFIADTYLQYEGTQKSLKIRGTGNTAPSLSCTLSINDAQGPSGKAACIGLTPTGAQGAKAIHLDLGAYNTGIQVNRNSSLASNAMIFQQNVSGSTQVGSISMTNGATAYNTTSDYRLKENVVEMTGSVDRVKQLKPSRFNFISEPDSNVVDGFLAHEVSSVVPEAIHGEKDAVDDQGNIIYQGIDQSKLVPLLVGAIKELTARIEALEA